MKFEHEVSSKFAAFVSDLMQQNDTIRYDRI